MPTHTWLDLVTMEAEGSEIDIEPDTEVEQTDHVVGEVSPELRKLFSISRSMQMEAEQTGLNLRYGREKNQEAAQEKMLMLLDKSKILMQIFWSELKDVHNLWSQPAIGVRKGWKVVWSDDDRPHFIRALESFLRD